MNKINLIGNLITDPFTIEPRNAKVKNRKAWKPKIKEKKKREITTMVMCGCGNHPINPKKDPYAQHNNWAAQFFPKQESGTTDIRHVQGIGSSVPKFEPQYDFSGDEFELSSFELRKHRSGK